MLTKRKRIQSLRRTKISRTQFCSFWESHPHSHRRFILLIPVILLSFFVRLRMILLFLDRASQTEPALYMPDQRRYGQSRNPLSSTSLMHRSLFLWQKSSISRPREAASSPSASSRPPWQAPQGFRLGTGVLFKSSGYGPDVYVHVQRRIWALWVGKERRVVDGNGEVGRISKTGLALLSQPVQPQRHLWMPRCE